MDLLTTLGTATANITLRWDVTAQEPKVEASLDVEVEAGQPFPPADVLKALANALDSTARQLREQADA